METKRLEELILSLSESQYPTSQTEKWTEEALSLIGKIYIKKLPQMTFNEAMHDFKKGFITVNIKRVNGNRTEAAKRMDIHRPYLSHLITKYGIREVL